MFPIFSPDDHLPNFRQVSTALYRGGQPTQTGFAQLKEMGVLTVINLRDESRLIEQERRILAEIGLNYLSIPLSPFRAPHEQDIAAFFKIMDDSSQHPAFIHCWHGMDRTGTFVGLYRLQEHGWAFEKTYAEMLEMGFHEEFLGLRQCVVKFAEKLNLK